MSTHNNSKKITIFRSNNFVIDAQSSGGESVMDFISLSSKPIGPYFESVTNGTIGTGLLLSEQDLLMPILLSISEHDKDYRKKINDYFNDLVTKVPPTTGIDLEIGLEKDNDLPLAKDNMPLNIGNYVRYRHAKNHPWVAPNRSEAKGNQLKYFYIHDADSQHQEDTDRMVVQDRADGVYLQIKSQEGKVKQLLVLLGQDPRDYAGRNAITLQQKALRDIVDKDAVQFLKVYDVDKFETRYWLKAMTTAGVVKLVGNTYAISESNKLLGRSELEAILFLEDKDNEDTVSFLKAGTQEVLAKPRTTKPRKPITSR